MRARGKPMLHRIVVNVIQMFFIVFGVSNLMLPKLPLPHAATTVLQARDGTALLAPAMIEPSMGEFRFDARPARRVIRIIGRKRPNRVKVIGEEDHSDRLEGPLPEAVVDDVTKDRTCQVRAENWASILGDKGEEIRPAANMSPAVAGHERNLALFKVRSRAVLGIRQGVPTRNDPVR